MVPMPNSLFLRIYRALVALLAKYVARDLPS